MKLSITDITILFDINNKSTTIKTYDIVGSPETHLWYDFCKLLSQTIKNHHKFETIFGNNKKEFYQLYLKHHNQLYTKVFNDTKDNSDKLYNNLKTTYYNITIKGYKLRY